LGSRFSSCTDDILRAFKLVKTVGYHFNPVLLTPATGRILGVLFASRDGVWVGCRVGEGSCRRYKAAKRFAEAMQTRTKTDAVDAAVLAQFAQRMLFTPW